MSKLNAAEKRLLKDATKMVTCYVVTAIVINKTLDWYINH